LIEITKVEIQIYYKNRVGMPVNLALCIEWACGWDCRLNYNFQFSLIITAGCCYCRSVLARLPSRHVGCNEDVDIEAVDDKRE